MPNATTFPQYCLQADLETLLRGNLELEIQERVLDVILALGTKAPVAHMNEPQKRSKVLT